MRMTQVYAYGLFRIESDSRNRCCRGGLCGGALLGWRKTSEDLDAVPHISPTIPNKGRTLLCRRTLCSH